MVKYLILIMVYAKVTSSIMVTNVFIFLECDPYCKTCFGFSDSECSSCFNGSLLINSQCIIKCDLSCATCFGFSNSECSSCFNDSLLINSQCILCDELLNFESGNCNRCLTGYYLNNDTSVCSSNQYQQYYYSYIIY